jgi:IclR family KDG regulon transcriptional repressor
MKPTKSNKSATSPVLASDKKNIIPMLAKSIQILERFRENPDGLTYSEVTTLCPNFSRVSIFRVLCSLERFGYLEKVHDNNRYVLGAKLVEFGRIAEARLELLQVAIPRLETLCKKYNENINLCTVKNRELVYFTTLESTHPLRVQARPNRRVAVYCSAVGKAILAHLPKGDIDRYLDTTSLVSITPNTITNKTELRRELQRINSRGYAVDNEENLEGVVCVGVPILNAAKIPVAGISMSGPSVRMSPECIVHAAADLKSAAKAIADKCTLPGKIAIV